MQEKTLSRSQLIHGNADIMGHRYPDSFFIMPNVIQFQADI